MASNRRTGSAIEQASGELHALRDACCFGLLRSSFNASFFENPRFVALLLERVVERRQHLRALSRDLFRYLGAQFFFFIFPVGQAFLKLLFERLGVRFWRALASARVFSMAAFLCAIACRIGL